MTKLSEDIEQKAKAYFFHIGKTGGSAFVSAIGNKLDAGKYSIQLRGHDAKLTDVPVGEKIFFFLRDPISRFVSGFYSRQRKGRPRYNIEWSRIEKEVFTTFSTPNALALALSDKLMPNHDLSVRGMNNIVHLSSYFTWFKDLGYFKSRINDILFIGFQETLDDDFEKLKQVLNLPISTSLPKDDISAHKTPTHLDTSLDGDATIILKQWYARDIEFVIACKELMASLCCEKS
jgi:Sulfotransferase family